MLATSVFPYQSGNAIVDIVLFCVWTALFGFCAGWGWKLSTKLFP